MKSSLAVPCLSLLCRKEAEPKSDLEEPTSDLSKMLTTTNPCPIRISTQRRRAFLELQLLAQLNLSGLRSEHKERRDMNENSSQINKLLRPRFSIPSDAKEKLDQKDGASEAKLALYMTETSNNVAFRDQIPGKMCSRERLAAASVISYCILLHPCKDLALCSVVYLSCKAVVYSFDH